MCQGLRYGSRNAIQAASRSLTCPDASSVLCLQTMLFTAAACACGLLLCQRMQWPLVVIWFVIKVGAWLRRLLCPGPPARVCCPGCCDAVGQLLKLAAAGGRLGSVLTTEWPRPGRHFPALDVVSDRRSPDWQHLALVVTERSAGRRAASSTCSGGGKVKSSGACSWAAFWSTAALWLVLVGPLYERIDPQTTRPSDQSSAAQYSFLLLFLRVPPQHGTPRLPPYIPASGGHSFVLVRPPDR